MIIEIIMDNLKDLIKGILIWFIWVGMLFISTATYDELVAIIFTLSREQKNEKKNKITALTDYCRIK